MGILRYEDGRIASSSGFAIDGGICPGLCLVVAVAGSRSDAGKTTACLDIIKSLHDNGRNWRREALRNGTTKGILELSVNANHWLDTADAGLPTTYPPSQENDYRTAFTVK